MSETSKIDHLLSLLTMFKINTKSNHNPHNNSLLFGKFPILFMKRQLLITVLACFCTIASAQNFKTAQDIQLMEVKAYLAYLKTSEVSSINSILNSNRLEQLLLEVQPSVYYLTGEVKTHGEKPTALYTNSSSLNAIDNASIESATIEMVTINLSQNTDLGRPLDLSVFSNFPNLKYIYILSNIETTGTVISSLIRNSNPEIGVFYKIDKGA